jgi:hypothetical protein
MTSSVARTATDGRSRRALLAGALGGLGAWAASAIGRASPARAEGQNVQVGGEYTDATSVTLIQNQTTTAAVFRAISTAGGVGIWSSSNSFYGIYSTSGSGIGVEGESSSSIGVRGYSGSATQPAIVGWSGGGAGQATGVLGFSGTVGAPTARAKTGVYGYANQDGKAKGIVGESSKGFAGYFLGKVYLSKFQEMKEISTPSAPTANKARLFLKDNGAGKTQLCVRFHSGAIQVLATQP